jgi:hypothetical protein
MLFAMVHAFLGLVMLAGPTAGAGDLPVPASGSSSQCASVSDGCIARADTRATISGSSLTFAPPAGWVYALGSHATLAQVSDAGPAVAFTGVTASPADPADARDAALAELAKQLGLGPMKRKVRGRKPDDVRQHGQVRLELWQVDGDGQRGASKGALLLVMAVGADGKVTAGLGFVPGDDKTASDAKIMKAVESLGV